MLMVTQSSDTLDPEQQRAVAIQLFNRTWEFLDQSERTAEDDEQMMHCAHASAWHWSQVGTDENRAISEWQIARVYSELGRGESALRHAQRAVDYAASAGIPWLIASSYEGLARAHAVAGDRESAIQWRDKAIAELEPFEDPEERSVIERDIATLPL